MNLPFKVTGVVLANASIDLAFHDSYYVVGRLMALNKNCLEIDCMQGTIFLVYYLLFKFNYLLKIDASQSFKLLLNSENNNNTVMLNQNQYTNIQSAENCFPTQRIGRSVLAVPAFISK